MSILHSIWLLIRALFCNRAEGGDVSAPVVSKYSHDRNCLSCMTIRRPVVPVYNGVHATNPTMAASAGLAGGLDQPRSAQLLARSALFTGQRRHPPNPVLSKYSHDPRCLMGDNGICQIQLSVTNSARSARMFRIKAKRTRSTLIS